jgi:F-type H+-transporting ATPase subunit b
VLHLEWSTLVFQLLNFFILLLVLGHFLYRPLMDAMQRREQAIAERVRDAEERAKRADAERTSLADVSRAAHAEADALLSRARKDAEQLKEKERASARQEAARVLEDAKRRIEDEERAAHRRLSAAARSSAVRVAASLIDKVAGGPFHEALVTRLLDSGLGLDSAKAELLRRARNHGGHEVIVETAYPLAAEVTSRLEEALTKALGPGGGAVHATIRVEPTLVAGLRVIVGVGVVDLSLPRMLADLERDAAASEP